MSTKREELLDEFQNHLDMADKLDKPIEIEAGVQDVLRRNGALLRRPQVLDATATPKFTALVQQVSGESMGENERLLNELSKVRERLQAGRDRVLRELSEYTALNQAAMTVMKAISEDLLQYRRTSTSKNEPINRQA